MRGEEPLVKAGRVVVTLQVRNLEVEMGECVGTVEMTGMSLARAMRTMSRTGRICPVRLINVAHEHQARLLRHARLEQANDLGGILGRHRKLDLLHHGAFPAFSLPEGRDHASTVLRRRQDLVASREIITELTDRRAFGR